MATYKTIGLVLGRHNLGEADRIVIILSPELGKIRAVAKGVRKIGSRQAGHVELFSQVQLMLAEGRNLDIITSAKLQHYPLNIVKDYGRLRQAYLIVGMVERLTQERSPSPGLYRLLSYGLNYLEQTGASARFELFFKLRLLGQLGYRPQTDICSRCGGRLEATWISAEHGGAVCAACAAPGEPAITPNQLGLWRRILIVDMNGLTQADESAALATLASCDTFYEYIFGRTFQAAT